MRAVYYSIFKTMTFYITLLLVVVGIVAVVQYNHQPTKQEHMNYTKNTRNINEVTGLRLSYTPHSPINITHDSEFSAFPGTGTSEDPYIISGLLIETTQNYGIQVNHTTKNFTIVNCKINATLYGIYIRNIESNTANLSNNICEGNEDGIHIYYSQGVIITNNECNNNFDTGIYVYNGDYSNITNNRCMDNQMGIDVEFSDLTLIKNNTCALNEFVGIACYASDVLVLDNNCSLNYHGINIRNGYGIVNPFNITNNYCYYNTYGIYLYSSNMANISYNDCSYNFHGIYLYEDCSWNVILYNDLYKNTGYGVKIGPICEEEMAGLCQENVIHHNKFYGNNPEGIGANSMCFGCYSCYAEAYDDRGINARNIWYEMSTNEGNYWSNWDGEGAYEIDCGPGCIDTWPASDPYPLERGSPRIEQFCCVVLGPVMAVGTAIIMIIPPILDIIIRIRILPEELCKKYPRLCPKPPTLIWKHRHLVIGLGALFMMTSWVWINFFPPQNIIANISIGLFYGIGFASAYLGIMQYSRILQKEKYRKERIS